MAVTTFRPPSATTPAPKPVKAASKSPTTIILGVVCLVFAGGAGFLFTQLNGEKARVATMGDGLVKIAEAAGSANLTSDDVNNPAATGDAINNLIGAVGTLVSEGEAARAEGARLSQEVQKLNAEKDAASVRMANVQSQLESTRDELAKSNQQNADQLKQHQHEVGELNARITGLNNQIEELDGEVSSLKAQVASLSPTSADAPAVVVEVEAEAEQVESGEPARQVLQIPAGMSKLFRSAAYDSATSRLSFTSLDGRTLDYTNIPAEVYDGLSSAPIVDVFYRFQILDKFNSSPKDLDFIPTVKAD